ncbi:MAG: PrgI family protein [Candidatus Komeilibacteria bacterium]|nr:PrgI family protein [Candidatus Komeilibacteria bacterium]
MQQFHVPQFIDVEDTIIGPITVRQFVIMLIGAFFCFMEYKLSDFGLFVVLAIFTVGIFALFAFFKINGMPFYYFLVNVAETLKKPKIRIWSRLRHQEANPVQVLEKPKETLVIHKPLVTKSQLQELSLLVDTGGAWQPANFDKTYDRHQ